MQPLAKQVNSYIKDTNHFLQKLNGLDSLPEDAILCTVDVVGLYPSITHDEGLESIREALNSRSDQSVSTETLLELMKLVLKNNFFEFNSEFFQQVRGTAIGTKCAPSYAILFLAALERKLLDHHVEKPLLWWRYIDDIFLIWTHGEEKFLEFINFLNSAHHSIKFTAEYSKESVNFLEVKVIRKEDRIITDLYTKPTDTHQLLHHSSCHPNHTKRGIPYGQALRLRRICSEETLFANRLGELETHFLDRGYKRGGIESQVNRVKGLDRSDLLDRSQNEEGDSRIPLVLTYHSTFFKVHEILRNCSNTLFADDKHRNLFRNKMYVSFRRAKNLKDTLVRAKLKPSDEEQVEKGTFRCNGRRSCQICPIVVEGNTFGNYNESRSLTNFSGAYNCNSQNVVYLLQCNICNKKYVGSTTTKFRQHFNVYKSYFRTYARKYNEGNLDRGKPVPQANFFAHFFGEGHQGTFSVSAKIMDGAHDVFSVRRKELLWQYKLGTFIPNGLNERAADVELDMFACGIA